MYVLRGFSLEEYEGKSFFGFCILSMIFARVGENHIVLLNKFYFLCEKRLTNSIKWETKDRNRMYTNTKKATNKTAG